MSLDAWFWVIFVLSLLFGFYADYTPGQPYPWRYGMRHFIMYILILIIGLKVFRGPIQ